MFGAGLGHGRMCLDVNLSGAGRFYGEVYADLTHGTARFEGASGSFLSRFSGTNLTSNEFGYGFGPIQATLKGSVIFPCVRVQRKHEDLADIIRHHHERFDGKSRGLAQTTKQAV